MVRFVDGHMSSNPKDADIHSLVTGLAEWLQIWECQLSPIDLCRLAYENRKSDFMRTLAKLSMEPTYKSNEDAIHHAFGLLRHYIGRLAHHIRAVDTLLSCASRLSELLYDFEVRSIPTPAKSALPPTDAMTRLESIIVRMLPAKSPDLDRYQQALIEMDVKYQLSGRFLASYTDHNLRPRVHAEIQVLEHFFANKFSFAAGDPYIACSKPACFCCLLYFRNHPGHFVEPTSHRKIYLNWRPPDPNSEDGIISQRRQRDILNAMTQDIRKEALRQIDEKAAPKAWHPDSITGITESVLHRPEQGPLKDDTDPLSTDEDAIALNGRAVGSEEGSRITELADFLPTVPDVEREIVTYDSVDCNQHDKSLQKLQPVSCSTDEDSDEEGGVLLECTF